MDSGDGERTILQRVGAAGFYAITSILIVFVNKSILTLYNFPSAIVLGIGQMVAAITVLGGLRFIGTIQFPTYSAQIPKQIFPLPIFYLCNMIFGLKSTKSLSLPMFTVLRRFSILMTMILEKMILQVIPTRGIVLSIVTMIFGAIVAASNDLAFDLLAYIYILSNDLFTAGYGVFTKKSLNCKDLGKYGLLFYNCLFSLPLVVILAYMTGDISAAVNYEGWTNPMFAVQFGLSCFMGFILMYSILLCTQFNSSLTTTVVGCMKNLFVTYAGMVFGGDYIFSVGNFIGINISVLGALVYSYFVFLAKKPKTVSLAPLPK